MKNNLKNVSRLKLADLLRRRRLTLHTFITESNITSFEDLKNKCDRMGVIAPDVSEFNEIIPPRVFSDPMEGMIVVEALPEPEPESDTLGQTDEPDFEPTGSFSRRKKKKKDGFHSGST